MTICEAKKLKPGHKVKWNDPANGCEEENCSRVIQIRSIKVRSDMVQITDTEGDYLECLAEELS